MKYVLTALLLLTTTLIEAQVTIKKVVLYKNGIGYFESEGVVNGGDPLELRFRANDMNDVLESISVRDISGGKIAGFRYRSDEPLPNKLAQFPFHVDDNEPLSAFLDRLKGARIQLGSGATALTGMIVSARQLEDTRPSRPTGRLTLLLDSGELRNLDLDDTASLRFLNPEMQSQLRRYLELLADERSPEMRALEIDVDGSKPQHLGIAYMVPTPVWQSSYRLILGQAGHETELEGWAIINNTSGNDWNNVQLALVSGRPVSFLTQLYQPLYLAQLWASLPEAQALTPELYEGGIGTGVGAGVGRGEGIIGGVPGGVPGGTPGGVIGGVIGGFGQAPAPPPPLAAARAVRVTDGFGPSSVQVNTATAAVGELFEYSFPQAITIRSNESAVIPFVQQAVTARKVLVETNQTEHPRNAVEIVNDAGKTLDGGPITIYDGGAYAGEALMATLPKGDKRLVSYAEDLSTRISTTESPGDQYVTDIHVRRGVMTVVRAEEDKMVYDIYNIEPKAKVLYIDLPVIPGEKPVQTQPVETTANNYRYKVTLAAAGETKFPIAFRRTFNNGLILNNLSSEDLADYVENKSVSAATRNQLGRVVDLKCRVAAVEGQMEATKNDLEAAARDEARTREDIVALNRVAGQQDRVRQYIATLDADGAQIKSLRAQVKQLEATHTQLQGQLDTLIAGLDF
jgi:hypothetical protein